MRLWKQLKHGVRSLTGGESAAAGIEEEARHYQEELASDFEAKGMSRDEAKRAARMHTGSVTAIREQVQDSLWENAVAGFTAAALSMLALGIGGTAALVTVIDSVLLKPMPYPEPDRLIALLHTAPGINIDTLRMSPSFYFTYREEAQVFESAALWNGTRATVTGPGMRKRCRRCL